VPRRRRSFAAGFVAVAVSNIGRLRCRRPNHRQDTRLDCQSQCLISPVDRSLRFGATKALRFALDASPGGRRLYDRLARPHRGSEPTAQCSRQSSCIPSGGLDYRPDALQRGNEPLLLPAGRRCVGLRFRAKKPLYRSLAASFAAATIDPAARVAAARQNRNRSTASLRRRPDRSR
jgi:hypothetical protein